MKKLFLYAFLLFSANGAMAAADFPAELDRDFRCSTGIGQQCVNIVNACAREGVFGFGLYMDAFTMQRVSCGNNCRALEAYAAPVDTNIAIAFQDQAVELAWVKDHVHVNLAEMPEDFVKANLISSLKFFDRDAEVAGVASLSFEQAVAKLAAYTGAKGGVTTVNRMFLPMSPALFANEGVLKADAELFLTVNGFSMFRFKIKLPTTPSETTCSAF